MSPALSQRLFEEGDTGSNVESCDVKIVLCCHVLRMDEKGLEPRSEGRPLETEKSGCQFSMKGIQEETERISLFILCF